MIYLAQAFKHATGRNPNNVDMSMLKIDYDNRDKNLKPHWFALSNYPYRTYDDDIDCLINNYPKEWLAVEADYDAVLPYDFSELRSYEPWWKLIVGNKALLPLLWSMYPGHPNLLPAFYDDPASINR